MEQILSLDVLRSGTGNGSGGNVVAQSADYHCKQATLLIELAQTTTDRETAKALMRMANEHIRLAEDSAQPTLRLASSDEK
jgi:hypothetical protein